MEVAKGVHRLTGGIVNFYLVEEAGKLTIVDAGAPTDWGLLAGAIARMGLSPTDLEAVLLTHAHSDHTGFAERARASGSPVWVHEADAAVAKGAKPPKNDGAAWRYLWRLEFYRTLISLARRGATKIVPVLEVSTYRDGETIEVPGSPRVVHVPGHTPGMCALLLEDRRALLSGDAVVTRNPLTGRTGPQIAPSGLNRDTPLALRSLDRLEGLGADVLLPGHGEPWEGSLGDAVREARAAGTS
ncbi:MAG TPA: MBL fold metallo-hydrolase [Actinomycetota bacterium]